MELTECALNAIPQPNGTCFTPKHVEIIAKYTDADNIKAIKQEMNCDSDKCILEKINLPVVLEQKIAREALKTPTNSLHGSYWINNTEIDTCMSQLRKMYPGFAHSYIHMSDIKMFAPENSKSFEYKVSELTKINLGECFKLAIEGKPSCPELSTYGNVPLKSVGIVFNTDDSSGGGQHWFAVYISMDTVDPQNTSKKMIRIEVFNSSGGEIESSAFQSFWQQKKIEIANATGLRCEYGLVSTVQHQRNDTGNCGSYSLFYIYARLRGCKPNEFNRPEKIVADKKMEEFRKILFTKK